MIFKTVPFTEVGRDAHQVSSTCDQYPTSSQTLSTARKHKSPLDTNRDNVVYVCVLLHQWNDQ